MAGPVESEVHVFSNAISSISYEVRRRTGQGNVKQFSTEHIASGKPRTLTQMGWVQSHLKGTPQCGWEVKINSIKLKFMTWWEESHKGRHIECVKNKWENSTSAAWEELGDGK